MRGAWYYRFFWIGIGVTLGTTWVAALLHWFSPAWAYGIVYGMAGAMWLWQGIWLRREEERLKREAQNRNLEVFQRNLEAMRECWRQNNETEPPI